MSRNQTSREGGSPVAAARLEGDELSVFLAGCGPGPGRVVRSLRRMVFRVAPGASEAVRFNCICYFEAGKHFGAIGGNICMIEAKGDGVRLSFIHGAVLKDPMGLLRGAGKHKRYVEVTSAAVARSEAIALLVRGAARRAAGATKRRTPRGRA